VRRLDVHEGSDSRKSRRMDHETRQSREAPHRYHKVPANAVGNEVRGIELARPVAPQHEHQTKHSMVAAGSSRASGQVGGCSDGDSLHSVLSPCTTCSKSGVAVSHLLGASVVEDGLNVGCCVQRDRVLPYGEAASLSGVGGLHDASSGGDRSRGASSPCTMYIPPEAIRSSRDFGAAMEVPQFGAASEQKLDVPPGMHSDDWRRYIPSHDLARECPTRSARPQYIYANLEQATTAAPQSAHQPKLRGVAACSQAANSQHGKCGGDNRLTALPYCGAECLANCLAVSTSVRANCLAAIVDLAPQALRDRFNSHQFKCAGRMPCRIELNRGMG
jgi:hypothetical protein